MRTLSKEFGNWRNVIIVYVKKSYILSFRIANNHLKFFTTYKQCQSNLLREEICQKKCTVQTLQKEFTPLKSSLQNELNLIDFAHVVLYFLESMASFWNRKV